LRELEQQQILHSVHGVGIFVREAKKRALTGNIGLVLHSYERKSNSDFSSVHSLIAGIREECRDRDLDILLIDGNETAHLEKMDGCLLYCDRLEAYAMNIPQELPRVLLLQHVDDFVTVAPDDFGAGKLAATALIKNGHRRIACLMEQPNRTNRTDNISTRRLEGYYAALQDAEISMHPQWLKLTKKALSSANPTYLKWGRDNMRQWLDADWQELGCTAIVVQNDHAAIGVIQTLQEAGIKVPEQVSVIGFDGTSICDLVSPRLSSVQMPYEEIGREAIKVLCEQIQNGSHAPHEITFPVSLRKGDSIMPPGTS
jgi:DNA-binding LacI/PurR family transcriptional regulator